MRSPLSAVALLDLGIEDSFSGGDFADGGAEFEIQRVLEHVALGARFDRLAHPGVLGVHAEHEDGGFGRVLDYRARGLRGRSCRAGRSP